MSNNRVQEILDTAGVSQIALHRWMHEHLGYEVPEECRLDTRILKAREYVAWLKDNAPVSYKGGMVKKARLNAPTRYGGPTFVRLPTTFLYDHKRAAGNVVRFRKERPRNQ